MHEDVISFGSIVKIPIEWLREAWSSGNFYVTGWRPFNALVCGMAGVINWPDPIGVALLSCCLVLCGMKISESR